MNKFIYIIILFSFFSCNTNEKYEDHQTKVNLLLKSLDDFDEKELVVIIPNEGCGGCISDAANYVFENLDKFNSKHIVVFTGIKDFKLFKLQFSKELIQNDKVLIDKRNIFMQEPMQSIYPQVIKLKEGNITSISVFDKQSLF